MVFLLLFYQVQVFVFFLLQFYQVLVFCVLSASIISGSGVCGLSGSGVLGLSIISGSMLSEGIGDSLNSYS